MLRIGICDDETKARDALRLGLEKMLWEESEQIVYEFSTGEGAVRWLKKHPGEIDLLFLDVEMKGISGMEAAAKIREFDRGISLVFVTGYTDYVFDGQGTKPWLPDCKEYKPLNVYGETKLEGEIAVAENLTKYFIVRIAWVFGRNGKNFIKTMLNVGKTHDEIKVVNDQIGTPTYTYDLAKLLVDMLETDHYGYYHATNEGGYISWYDFTKEIFRQAVELGHTEYSEDRLTVIPVTTQEYGISKAARPFNSRLDKGKLVENGFTPLPSWQDALRRYLKEVLE